MNSYIGRFAPSPTGLLHIGSLLAAVASYADARASGGTWLVRIEDLDPPREMAGAASQILHTLDAFSLHWDGEVVYQSRRYALYEAILHDLLARDLAYFCRCSRRVVALESTQMGIDGAVYGGRCARQRFVPKDMSHCAIRLRVPDREVVFEDRILGCLKSTPAKDTGDFILRRADGFWAYQLAVVADDAEQGITHIVRGRDLCSSTPRQIILQQQLGLKTPVYAHLPLLTNPQGQKWSKQTRAAALDTTKTRELMRTVIGLLGFTDIPDENCPVLLRWLTENWNIRRIPSHDIAVDEISGLPETPY